MFSLHSYKSLDVGKPDRQERRDAKTPSDALIVVQSRGYHVGTALSAITYPELISAYFFFFPPFRASVINVYQ